jgi:hypothetical protein
LIAMSAKTTKTTKKRGPECFASLVSFAIIASEIVPGQTVD